jgi:DNA-binding transcriptional ArsR family regulator
MSETDDQERPAADAPPYRFEDPRSIRALAHPARLAIIDALSAGDELTATQCAELTGLSPSATAYHLKLLERYGVAEPAPPRPDRRERPWRAAGRQVRAELDTSTPAGAAAAAAVIDSTRAIAVEFTEGSDAELEQWRHTTISTSDPWLTPEEFARVARDLAAVVAPYRGRPHPQGSRPVRIMNVVVPRGRAHPGPDEQEA